MSNLFEQKTTEAAAFFLKRAGGSMEYLKLLKLLYLADREAIKVNGLPITFDNYCSMDNGPVLSKTYDWIKGQTREGYGDFWLRFIRLSSRYSVSLAGDAGSSHLSEIEREILEGIFINYNRYDKYELVEITHKLPEYKKPPEHSSLPITISEVINAVESDSGERQRLSEDIAVYKLLNG